jgi:hypothetical protein
METAMTLEHAWYEASPYLYAVVGLGTALGAPPSIGMRTAATVMVLVPVMVLVIRLLFRRGVFGARTDFLDERKYAVLITQEMFSEPPLERPNVRRRSFH